MKKSKNSSFSTISPWIYFAGVGGNPVLVKLSASKLSTIVENEVNGDEDSILGALSNISSHEELLELKRLDDEFKSLVNSLGFSSLKSLTYKIERTGGLIEGIKELFPQLLTLLILAEFALVLLCLLVFNVKVESSLRDVLLVLIGTLTTSMTGAINYYLGTSSSSLNKDRTIQNAIDKNK